MHKKIIKLILILLVFTNCGCSMFGIRSGYEQLSYDVVESINYIEIRNYPKRIAVEIQESSSDKEAFFALFDYISGDNSNKSTVSMTSPVEVNRENIKIEMTSPVEKVKNNSKVKMRFFLPKEFTLQSAPNPKNPKVKLIEIPEQTYAVLIYSGFNSEEKFQNKIDELKTTLSQTKYRSVGEPTYFGYDPPFTIPFLRKHEVLIPVN